MPCSLPRRAFAGTCDAAQSKRHRAGVRRHPVVGGAIASLRQPTTGCRLCRSRAVTLAERLGRSRSGGFESRQSKAANDTDPTRVAVAASSTAIGTHPVVRGPGKTQLSNGGRLKKTTIVALARKLLVALWKYVNAGVIIEGAAMKTA